MKQIIPILYYLKDFKYFKMLFRKLSFLLPFILGTFTFMNAQKTEVVAGVTWDLASERAQNISGLAYQLFFDIPAEKSAPIPAKVDISLNLKHKAQPLLLDFKVSRENLQKVTVNKKIVPIDFVAGHLIIDPIHLNVGENKIQIELQDNDKSIPIYYTSNIIKEQQPVQTNFHDYANKIYNEVLMGTRNFCQ